MQTIPQEQVLKRWDEVPSRIREVIVSPDSSKIIQDLLSIKGLPPESYDIVAREVGYVLLGFEQKENVAHDLEEAIKIPEITAQDIAQKLDDLIFSEVEKEIKQIHEAGKPISFFDKLKEKQEERERVATAEAPQAPIAMSEVPFSVSAPQTTPQPPIYSPEVEKNLPPQKQAEVPSPVPLTLHEETEAKPIATGKIFSLKTPGGQEGGSAVDLLARSEIPTPGATTAATVSVIPKQEKTTLSTKTEAPRVRNYGAFAAPKPPTPQGASALEAIPLINISTPTTPASAQSAASATPAPPRAPLESPPKKPIPADIPLKPASGIFGKLRSLTQRFTSLGQLPSELNAQANIVHYGEADIPKPTTQISPAATSVSDTPPPPKPK